MKITAGDLSIELEKELVTLENVTMAIQAVQQLVALQTERRGIDLGLNLTDAEKAKAAGV